MDSIKKGILTGFAIVVGKVLAEVIGVPELGEFIKTLVSGGGGN